MEDLVWICDLYKGHGWAWNNISHETQSTWEGVRSEDTRASEQVNRKLPLIVGVLHATPNDHQRTATHLYRDVHPLSERSSPSATSSISMASTTAVRKCGEAYKVPGPEKWKQPLETEG